MSDYSQAIYALDKPSRSKIEAPSLAALFLPSFGTVVFAVALLQVLFLGEGAQILFRDSDTGWHVRNGEAILDTAAVPRVDPFSYTRESRPWFAWEWMSDVLLGAAHRTAGLPGVALLASPAIALSIWGSARLSLTLGGNFFFTAGAAVLLMGTTSIHWLARPHVFSWLLALVFLSIAEHERRSPGRALYVLPVVACIWANLHGSFMLGPAILYIYAAGEWLGAAFSASSRSERKSIAQGVSPGFSASGRRFALAGLASLLATFINPYGWRLHEHIVSYLGNTYLMDRIAEFRSFSFHADGALYVELFLLIGVLGSLALLRQRAFGPAILVLAMLHLSLYSARHIPVAAILLLPLCVAALSREARNWLALRTLLDYSDRVRSIDRRVRGFAPMFLILAMTLVGLNRQAEAGHVGFSSLKFPVAAAGFLEKQNRDSRIYAKDQWGGYLIYRFNGRMKVFMDGRSDFYGRDFLETYSQLTEVKPGWDQVLKQHDVQFVLAPPDHALSSVLEISPNWKRVYSDSVAVVFEKVSGS